MKHLVIVCGYGCHLVPELKDYLNRVAEFCNKKRPDYLILCGGFTQRKSAPGKSEAQVMEEYLLTILEHEPLVIIETHSYTTPDNIANAAERIRACGLLETNTVITVFCEATRALKVDLLVRHFIGRRANIETASWELMSPTKQIISTIYDLAAIKFPPLASYFRNKRIRRAEQI